MSKYPNVPFVTRFMDVHSGGYTKNAFEKCYIACEARRALIYFTENFGCPDDVACSCCGSNYSYDYPGDESDLVQSTGYDRNGKDLDEYLDRDDVLFVSAETVDAYFAANPE